jgi:hypothetical protein
MRTDNTYVRLGSVGRMYRGLTRAAFFFRRSLVSNNNVSRVVKALSTISFLIALIALGSAYVLSSGSLFASAPTLQPSDDPFCNVLSIVDPPARTQAKADVPTQGAGNAETATPLNQWVYTVWIPTRNR